MCTPNKKGAPKGELTHRTRVITQVKNNFFSKEQGSKGELILRGTFLIWCTQALELPSGELLYDERTLLPNLLFFC